MKTRLVIAAALALLAAAPAHAGFKGGVKVASGDVNGDGKAARGGVNVSAGDINGDGRADCTTAAKRTLAARGGAGTSLTGSHVDGSGGGKVAVHDISITKACEAARADKPKEKPKTGTFSMGGGGGAGKPN